MGYSDIKCLSAAECLYQFTESVETKSMGYSDTCIKCLSAAECLY